MQETWVRSGKIPHAKEQLSLRARTIEPVLLRSGAQEPRLLKAEFLKARALLQEKPRQGEAWAPQLESGPCLPQLEKSHEATQTQHNQSK